MGINLVAWPLINLLKPNCRVFRVALGEVEDYRLKLFKPTGRILSCSKREFIITERHSVLDGKETQQRLEHMGYVNRSVRNADKVNLNQSQ